MLHTESTIKIYHTNEYGRFRIIQGNRQLNEAKINKIRSDIEDGIDFLKYCPIIVVENGDRLDIVDGQHRFFVAKQLGSRVWYIIAQATSLYEIAKVNSNTEKWKDRDFINCYVQNGNEQYAILQEFKERTGFPVTVCIKLLTKGTVSTNGGVKIKDDFQSGKFIVLTHNEACLIAQKVALFKDFKHHNTGPFVEAICKVIGAGIVSVEEIAEKWLKNPKALEYQGTAKAYLTNLESIYNLNAHKRRTIYQ